MVKRITAVVNTLMAALISSSAMAYADCGDTGKEPCAGPVPTVDQIVAIFAELTDPNRPAASKTDIVTPGFTPEEAGTIDDHLNRSRGVLPLNFVATNIQPAPNNFAGATLGTRGWPRQSTWGRPIVLVEQGGHWLLTHDSAVTETYWFWQAAARGEY
jgi:hypothetical protein